MEGTPKIGSRPTAPAETAPEAPAKGGKKKLIIIVAGAVVVLGAAYWFLAGPGKAAPATETDPSAEATASAEPSYELGEVVVVESISINLKGGHYLRLGFGLQLTTDAMSGGPSGETFDTAKALDAAIAIYSGHTTEELAEQSMRDELKAEFIEVLKELYHEGVVDVYYTDFVTQ